MTAIKHPTIMRMIGFSYKDFRNYDYPTILMEYYPNGSLLNILIEADKSCTPEYFNDTNCQIILTGIACGMKYLHSNRIIHRDLKPSNILIDDNFHPIITDFGLSKFFEIGQSHDQSHNIGTTMYMAPEFINDENYGPEVDVYSFGILMYEVLTKSFAFPKFVKGQISYREFMNKVSEEDYRPDLTNKEIKESLKNLMVQCWDRDPGERPNFDYIFNKLANCDNKEPGDKDSFLLNDVNNSIFMNYVDEISKENDTVNNLFYRIQLLCKENLKLVSENANLKVESKQKIIENDSNYEEENEQLILKNSQLKEENERLSAENKIIALENEKLESRNHFFDTKIRQMKNEKELFKAENRQQNKRIQHYIRNHLTKMNEEEDFEEEDFTEQKIMDDLKVKYKLSKKYHTAKIIGSLNVKGDYTIPKSIQYRNKEYLIVEIGDEAFSNSSITKLNFSDDSEIDYIGDFAFQNSEIEEINIPKNLRRVSKDWIQGAEHLKAISINQNNEYFLNKEGFIIYRSNPKSNRNQTILFVQRNISGFYYIPKEISHIGSSSFYKLEKLIYIETKEPTLQTINSYSFSNCDNLEKVCLKGSSKLNLYSNCFSKMKKLKSIVIECQSIFIDEISFNECSKLTTVHINCTKEVEIYSHVFNGCSEIKNIAINQNAKDEDELNTEFKVHKLESIILHKKSFIGCSLITSVSISNVDNVELGSQLFLGCNKMNCIEITNSKNIKISKACFSRLSELKSISFDSQLISIENNFVDKCPSLINISITSIDNLDVTAETFKNCNSVKNIKLNTQSKLSLNNNSFKEMNHLETIELSFQSIGDHQKLFENCFKLQTITIKSGEDILFTNDFFTGCTSLKTLQLSCKSTLQLTNKFMKNSTKLESVFLKSYKISIGDCCF